LILAVSDLIKVKVGDGKSSLLEQVDELVVSEGEIDIKDLDVSVKFVLLLGLSLALALVLLLDTGNVLRKGL